MWVRRCRMSVLRSVLKGGGSGVGPPAMVGGTRLLKMSQGELLRRLSTDAKSSLETAHLWELANVALMLGVENASISLWSANLVREASVLAVIPHSRRACRVSSTLMDCVSHLIGFLLSHMMT